MQSNKITEVLAKHLEKLYFMESKFKDDNYDAGISEIFKYAKNVTLEYLDNDGLLLPQYNEFLNAIRLVEKKYSGNEKRLDLSIPFSINQKTNNGNFLDDLVFNLRKHLLENSRLGKIIKDYNDVDFGKCDLTNYCLKAQLELNRICQRQKIKNYPIKITPGYAKGSIINNELNFHCLNIILYNEKYYLVDITFIQFFTNKLNNIDRLGVVGLSGCNVGTYLLRDERQRKFALELAKKGYIELTEERFKLYMDAFTLSFRNGLYYENSKIVTCDTGYTIDDYVRFLDGEDNQLKEGIENLGYQKLPLKNPNFDFRKIIKRY